MKQSEITHTFTDVPPIARFELALQVIAEHNIFTISQADVAKFAHKAMHSQPLVDSVDSLGKLEAAYKEKLQRYVDGE